MARAIELSIQNVTSGDGGPFASVIVKDGTIIAEATNRVTSLLVKRSHGTCGDPGHPRSLQAAGELRTDRRRD